MMHDTRAEDDVPVVHRGGERVAVPLRDAGDVDRFGAKAANLAVCIGAGMRVPDGVAIGVAHTDGPSDDVAERLGTTLDAVFDQLGEGGRKPLVVRSSSPQEDTMSSSMAGRFASVVGVDTREGLTDAVAAVVASRDEVAGAEDAPEQVAVAVLIQPLVPASAGGVLFTADPVTGERDRAVVSVAGDPDAVVSGEVAPSRYVLDRHDASVVEHEPGEARIELDAPIRERLGALADELERVFGGDPQDAEWVRSTDGELWLLQSRPITRLRDVPIREGAEVPDDHRILGPGPVAETFPEALGPLEQDLWLPPLDTALRHVFRLIGAAPDDDIDRSPMVVAVEGRVAVDLEMFGAAERDRPLYARLDPRPKIRNLRTSWRVGRLRNSLMTLGGAVVDDVDERLANVPRLGELSSRQLLGMLDRVGEALMSVHAHEVLIGLLVEEEAPSLTAPSVALRLLATERADGLGDAEIVRRHPIVLALAPPRICSRHILPAVHTDLPPRPVSGEDADETLVLREALRLRVRWLQELQSRACLELGHRLVERGVLDRLATIRTLQRRELDALVLEQAEPWTHDREDRLPSGASLPSAFCFTRDRDAIVPTARGAGGGGTGAGGGTGRGPVHLGSDPSPGDVAVVRTLDPGLGAVVGELAGLVSESGSVLSHVAILAREAGVPTVVGLEDATNRLEEGQQVEVDGDNGTVEAVED